MARPSLRRTLNLESLETRQVLSTVVGPTPDQQYALELINLVRTDPSAAVTEITSNISPDVQATLNQYGLTVSGLVSKMDSATAQPPLAWSDALGNSAQQQSQYEADNSEQTHQGTGEASLDSRINSAGYTNDISYGENTYAYADSIEEAMQAFLFDWGVSDDGHYNNLLQPGTSAEDSYKDVGIGLVNSTNGVGPLVITQDFGSQNNEGPQIVGVVYNDPNNTGFYAEGEGLGGVTVNVENLSTGQNTQVQTWSAGGYQVPVAANTTYQVTATQNGQVISSQQVQVGDVNVEADFVNKPNTNPPAEPQIIATPTTVTSVTPTSDNSSPASTSNSSSPASTSNSSSPASTSNSSTQSQGTSSDSSQTQPPNQQDQSSSQSQDTSNTNDGTATVNVSGWSHWTA
jgi:uncharacterized protein YkwD